MLFVLDNKQFRKTFPLVYLLFLKFPLQAKGGDYSGNLSSITEVTISYVSAADAIKNSLLNVFLQKNSKLSDLSFGALYSSDTSIPGIHNLVDKTPRFRGPLPWSRGCPLRGFTVHSKFTSRLLLMLKSESRRRRLKTKKFKRTRKLNNNT